MTEAERFKGVLRQIVEQVDQLWVEREACRKLAVSKGATCFEVEQAMRDDLDDPVIRAESRETFRDMWTALESAGLSALFDEMLQSLPPTDRPN